MPRRGRHARPSHLRARIVLSTRVATAAGALGVTAGDPVLSTPEAVLTLVGWALVPLVAGIVVLQRRDA